MQNVNRQLDKTGKQMQNVGKKLSVGLTLPLVALGAASIKAFDKQAKSIAQVEAGLKSTGGQVGRTSEQLQQMASDLQNKTLFGDEVILKDATAQLLTFTNIAGTQFDRTQVAALDLATRLDGDLKSASIQLGKALNDPVANLSALSRSGIQFSTEQKKVINALVATNRLADAQTIILDELERQYGGSAEAAAKAGSGPLQQLGNILGDVTEDFGKIILEGIQPFVDKIKDIALSFKQLSPETKKWILIIGGIAAAIGPLLIITGTLIRNVATLIPLIKGLTVAIAANPIGALAVAVTALAGGLLLANSRLTPLTDATKEFSELTAKATDSVAREKVELEKYLRIAKNDAISKEGREKAIKKLNALSPKYLGDLTLETVNTEAAKKATDDYVQSLLTKAKLLAAEDKLVEVQKKLLDLQLQGLDADAAQQSLGQKFLTYVAAAGSAQAGLAKQSIDVKENFAREKTELEKLQAALISFIGTNDTLGGTTEQTITPTVDLSDKTKFSGLELFDFNKQKETLASVDGLLNNTLQNFANAAAAANIDLFSGVSNEALNNSLESGTEAMNAYVENFSANATKLQELGFVVPEEFIAFLTETNPELLAKAGEDFTNYVSSIELEALRMQDFLNSFNEGISSAINSAAESFATGFGEMIGNIAAGVGGTQNLAQLFLGTIADMAIQLGKLAISIGIAVLGIKKALQSLNPAVAIAAGIALVALGTLVKSSLTKISQGGAPQGFAQGGVIGGSSFYGDKLLIAANSGELVLNQEQQKNLYNTINNNTATTNIVLSGVLRGHGRELIAVIDSTNIQLSRTR